MKHSNPLPLLKPLLIVLIWLCSTSQSDGQTVIGPKSHTDVTNLSNPGNAWDGNDGTSAYASLGRGCSTTCTALASAGGTFDDFDEGYTPLVLRVHWWAYTGMYVPSGNAALVTATLEYEAGAGWQTAESYSWSASSPPCTNNGITCSTHVAEIVMDPSVDSASVKVRVTMTAQMTQCTTCTPFGLANLSAQMKIYEVSMSVVCAIPTNFHETASYDAGSGVLNFEYGWDSSSGSRSDLKCEIGEKVDYDPNDLPFPSPPFAAVEPPANPFILNVPDARTGIMRDYHFTDQPFVKPYSAQAIVASQIYRYRCACYNSGDWLTLLGPHDVVRSIIYNGDGTWRFVVTKTGASATIDPLP